jgi:hypothetical protein
VFTRTLVDHKEDLRKKFRPVDWISRLQKRMKETSGTQFGNRPALQDTLKLIGIIVFYGLVFSLLDRTWNPFSLQGLILFLSMTIAYGLVGIADDIIQWRAIRKWGQHADLTVRPTNLLLAMASTTTSRLLSIIPGLMFGTPEALVTQEDQFDEPKRNNLLKISVMTFVFIGLVVWLPTIITALLQRLPLGENALNLIGGLEGFLLVVFAVALENLFVQMLGFPGGFGQALKRRNKWLWLLILTAVTFLFYHTLINPRGELAEALRTGNVQLFFGIAIAFMAVAFGLSMYFHLMERHAAGHLLADAGRQTTKIEPADGLAKPIFASLAVTKQCPVCCNQIKAEARVCRYCRATFTVILRGYCLTDHDVVETTAEGKCGHCGGEVADKHVESRLLKAPAILPIQPPEPVQVPAQVGGDTRSCPACGQIIKAEARLCRFCKTRFS